MIPISATTSSLIPFCALSTYTTIVYAKIGNF